MAGALAEPVAARRQRPFGTVPLTKPVRRSCRNARNAVIAGDKYDPSQTTTQNLESTLQGGFYWLNGEKYVKIKQMAHNGTMQDVYAKSIAADVAPGGVWDAYSLGDVMNMSSNQTDALRTQLKQDYFNASTTHESTLMLNEREKTMWSLWDYADQQGKQYSGFKVMAGDYQENSTNVFKAQQQQNASLVTQQWDLRKQQLDDAFARWQNLADTIEKRGTESFAASEQRFLKAWRQWEIETNRKIDAGKQQWNDKIKTFLVAKQDWQTEIKGAALEQSLDKMLGATGSALNERLRVLAANSDITTDIPEMNVTQIVSSAMDDFERSRPSVDKIFGEINKSITAFNTTLELGNATHFKGFTSTTLEGNFAGEMTEFSKHMAILNNAKMYENFKKMIDSFKANLKKTDIGTFKSLDTAAVAAGYHLSGGSYNKEVRDNNYRMDFDFMAYRYADIDAIMNRSMTEAGLDMATLTDGAKVVDLLEKKSDVDVKIFFEVQTMALEQAFKLAGGERGKKGYYQQYSGEQPQWKGYGGDLISEGAGEQGGWENGAKNNKLAWRGLHEEESKLSSARADWQTAAQVTNGVITAAAAAALTIGGCGGCAVALSMTMMGLQTTAQVGASFSSNKSDQAWGQLGMGVIQMGVSALGSLVGGLDYFGGMAKDATTLAKISTTAMQVTLQNAVSYAGSGFYMGEDGSIGYKGPSKGTLMSTLVSTGFGVAGGALNAGVGFTGRTAGMVTTAANSLGAGFQFNDDGSSKAYDFGKMGISFAANTASTMASYYAGNAAGNQYVGSQVGRLAHTVTAAALGDKNALQNYTSQGLFSAIGNNLGDYAARRANGDVPNNQPLREIFLGSTIVTSRREQEGQEEQKSFDPLGDAMDKGVEATKGAFTKAANWTKENLLNPMGDLLGNAATGVGNFFKEQVGERFSNLLQSRGFKTNEQFYDDVGAMIGGLGNGSDLYAGGMSPGSRAIKLTPEQQKVVELLKKWQIATDAFDNKLVLQSDVDMDKLGKKISKDAVGLQLLRRYTKEVNGYTNVIDENFNVITKSSDSAALQRWGAYINGDKDENFITDGDGVALNSKGQMVPLNNKAKIAAYLMEQRAPVLLTQNGMQNTIMGAVDMMERANYVARTQGAFKGTSLMIFNDTEGYAGDIKKYQNSSEESQKTVEYLLQQGVFKDGDIMIGHSQGGQILTNAIAANAKYVPVQLLVFGSAHTKTPNNFVKSMMDFRNENDPIAGERVLGFGGGMGYERDEPNKSTSNYGKFEQTYETEALERRPSYKMQRWGFGTSYGRGGTFHGFSENYVDALSWYLSTQKGGKF